MFLLLEGLVLATMGTSVVALSLRALNVGHLTLPILGTVGPGLVIPGLLLGTGAAVGFWYRYRARIRASRFIPVVVPLFLLVAAGPPGAKVLGQIRERLRAEDGADRIRSRPMTEEEAHAFGLRLIGTVIADSERVSRTISDAGHLAVSDPWPLPEGLEFRIEAEGTHTWVYSRRNGKVCRILLSSAWRRMGENYQFTCISPDYAPQEGWSAVRRTPETPDLFFISPSPNRIPVWPQYRYDARRSGGAGLTDSLSRGSFWYASLEGPARSTISVIGSLFIVGTHGNGILEAHDLISGTLRWRVREPNWIHQDAIGDHQAIYVGFGDNLRSFQGAAPSGIAAHDLQTGRRLWTTFTDNSVMTAPALHDSLVILGTAAGRILALHRASGHPVWEAQLPGNIMMAPPLIRGDSLIFTLDPRSVCVLDASSGALHRCQRLPPTLGGLGHISPAASDTRLLGSGVFHPANPGELLFSSRLQAIPMLWKWLTTGLAPTPYQAVYALSLRTGVLEWVSPLDTGTCCAGLAQSGHMSGTPVLVPHDSSLVVVSPYADRVYRLDEQAGTILARSAPIPTFPRGPALVVDSTVIAVDRQGVIHVLAVDDLHERCAIPLGEPVDRAGPTFAAGALLIAGREGGLYSIPAAPVLACDPDLPQRLAELRRRGPTGPPS